MVLEIYIKMRIIARKYNKKLAEVLAAQLMKHQLIFRIECPNCHNTVIIDFTESTNKLCTGREYGVRICMVDYEFTERKDVHGA